MSDAENICHDPDSATFDIIAEVAEVAKRANSTAWRYVRAEDGSLYEVRVEVDESFLLTPVDKAGRPIGAPVPQGDDTAYHHGQRGVSGPSPSYREQIAAQEQKKAQELASMREEAWRSEQAAKLAELEQVYEAPAVEVADAPYDEEPEKERGKVARFFLGP